MHQVFKVKNFACILALLLCGTFNSFSQNIKDSLKAKSDTASKKIKFKSEALNSNTELTSDGKKYLKKGDLLFSIGPLRYEEALNEYLKALETNPDNSLVNFKVGFCYLHVNKYKAKSILYLEKSLLLGRRNRDVKIRYYIAQAYQVNHNMRRAVQEYKKYIDEVRDDVKFRNKDATLEVLPLTELETRDISDAYNRIDECLNWMESRKKPANVRVINLGDSINSEYPDYGPFINADESVLLFTSRRKTTKGGGKAQIDGGYYEDVYIAERQKNGRWGKAERMKEVNTNTNDAIVGLSNDGSKMLLYRDDNGGDIYLSERKKGGWSRPRNIVGINSEYHESSASFSSDYKSIYFVSNRPGGEGGKDIYMSTKNEKGDWGKPVNLGSDINTLYDEVRVYLHPDGKTMLFASKGHTSMGGFDVFKSVLENGKWSMPENVGYPINDVDDDISFVVSPDWKHGYYSSYKENGVGEKDIYLVRFIEMEDSTMRSIPDSLAIKMVPDTINMDINAMRAFVEGKNYLVRTVDLNDTSSVGDIDTTDVPLAIANTINAGDNTVNNNGTNLNGNQVNGNGVNGNNNVAGGNNYNANGNNNNGSNLNGNQVNANGVNGNNNVAGGNNNKTNGNNNNSYNLNGNQANGNGMNGNNNISGGNNNNGSNLNGNQANGNGVNGNNNVAGGNNNNTNGNNNNSSNINGNQVNANGINGNNNVAGGNNYNANGNNNNGTKLNGNQANGNGVNGNNNVAGGNNYNVNGNNNNGSNLNGNQANGNGINGNNNVNGGNNNNASGNNNNGSNLNGNQANGNGVNGNNNVNGGNNYNVNGNNNNGSNLNGNQANGNGVNGNNNVAGGNNNNTNGNNNNSSNLNGNQANGNGVNGNNNVAGENNYNANGNNNNSSNLNGNQANGNGMNGNNNINGGVNYKGINLILNSDFSQGNTAFSSGYTYCSSSDCSGNFYSVNSNSAISNSGFTSKDHTTGAGNFMSVNEETPANAIIWSQTVSVMQGNQYLFSSWVSSLHKDIDPAQLQFFINGKLLGSDYTAPAEPNEWKNFSALWNSEKQTTAVVSIVNKDPKSKGNDFGLDDISLIQVNPNVAQNNVGNNNGTNLNGNQANGNGVNGNNNVGGGNNNNANGNNNNGSNFNGNQVNGNGVNGNNNVNGGNNYNASGNNNNGSSLNGNQVNANGVNGNNNVAGGNNNNANGNNNNNSSLNGNQANGNGMNGNNNVAGGNNYNASGNNNNGSNLNGNQVNGNGVNGNNNVNAGNNNNANGNNNNGYNLNGNQSNGNGVNGNNNVAGGNNNNTNGNNNNGSNINFNQANGNGGNSNLVINPDFNQGNNGFVSVYAYCPSSLCESGSYAIYPNAPILNSSVTPTGNNTGTNNYFMIINGSDIPDKAVWSQTISVIPDAQYIFSCKVSSLYSLNSPKLQISINGTSVGDVFSSPAATGVWTNFTTVWDSKKSITAVISVLNQNTNTGSFGLDAISFIQVNAIANNNNNNNNGTNANSDQANSNRINNNAVNGTNANNNLEGDMNETAESWAKGTVLVDGATNFKSILFDFNKSTINEQGVLELNKLIEYLQQNPDYRVKITGHTDSKGNDQYNLALSHKRALSVSAYITGKGVGKKKVIVEFKGEAQPVAPNENPDKSDNPDGRKLNRRVDLVIVINLAS